MTTDSESTCLKSVGAILDNNQVQIRKECRIIRGGDERCTEAVPGTREWAEAQHLIVVTEPLLQGQTNTPRCLRYQHFSLTTTPIPA